MEPYQKTADLLTAIDVEFLIENDGTFLPAGLFLPFQGLIGTDNQGHGAGMRHTAEIRTRPLGNVKQVVSDIGRALTIFADHVRPHAPEMIFLAGHYHHQQCIGGHVHFSSAAFQDWRKTEAAIKMLHKMASLFSYHFDDPAQIEHRVGRGYFTREWADSIRTKKAMFDIPNYHWEFRQWGSFLVSPVYAYATIALSKACILGVLEDARTPALWKAMKKEEWHTPSIIEGVLTLNLPHEDLRDLPAALEVLENTRPEIRARWAADFLELW